MSFRLNATPFWLRILLGCALLCGLCVPTFAAQGAKQDIKIGVLALQGVPQALSDWTATAHYLNQKIPDHFFVIVPLPFDQIDSSVADRQVDFVIANSAIHLMLAEHHRISPVLTMVNRMDSYNASLFGGVIFRNTDNNAPTTLAWLKGKHVMAVDRNSLGGFLAAWRELHQQGIDPFKDFASLNFAGTHEAVVRGVLAGRADAGTVRTDVLERMAAQGEINLSALQVLGSYDKEAQRPDDFPYLRSTQLYPEWPISRLQHVSDTVARRVAIALLEMPPNSPAATNAHITGWNVLSSYLPVTDLLRELALPPFERQTLTLTDVIRGKPWVTILLLVGCVITAALFSVLLVLNHRLRRARRELIQTNTELEVRVQERTQTLERRNVDLAEMATHDALTGLLNRRALDSELSSEINRVNRYGQLLSVLMVDIDWFKKVNDLYGHLAGDVVLREVAQAIAQNIRNTDIAGRYGGEEFVILLPMTSPEDAGSLAERLRQSVENQNIDMGTGDSIRITISVGVASAHHAGEDRALSLLDKAEEAMCQAKAKGRNCVHIA